MSLFNRVSGGRNAGSNPGNKPVCKFYLEGRCRFGDACHNYHPPRDQTSTGQSGKQQLPFHLSVEGVKSDLTHGDDRPGWPLSAYGPGRDAPRQLLEGTLEQSPEELRVLYYLAKAGGSTQEYEQNERSALDQADQRAQQILNDVGGAINYIVDGKDQHPNRDDEVQKNTGSFRWEKRPSPGQSEPQASSSLTLGQASNFGSGASSAFGQPSNAGSGTRFGASSSNGGSTFGGGQTGATPAFGSASALGRGSAFGQSSTLGGGPSAFGRPSAPGGGPAFGAQNTSGSSPFGQTSSNTGTSPFAQSSTSAGGPTFGQPAAPNAGSAFGQPSAPGTNTAFGKPSAFGAAAPSNTPAFGSSTPFGAQASTTTSAFGQPSRSGQQQSAFGQASQPAQQQSAFGQPSQPSPQPSAFGQPSQAGQQQSAFGKPSPLASSGGGTSAFGQPAFGGPTNVGASSGTSAFGRPSSSGGQQASSFGGSAQSAGLGSSSANASNAAFGNQQPPTNSSTSASIANRPVGQPLTSFKGQPVTYEDRLPLYRNPATGKPERIWFPDGPPGPNTDVEAAPETYSALGAVIKQVYDYVRDYGTFKDGVVPEVPPKREWISWDL